MPSYIPNIPYVSDLLPLKHAPIAEETAVSTLAKPQMRGLLKSAIKRHLAIGFTLAAMSGFAYKTLVGDVRKRKYAEFYRNYDAEKVCEDIRRKGLFQSC